MEAIKKVMLMFHVTKEMVINKAECKKMIHVVDPKHGEKALLL